MTGYNSMRVQTAAIAAFALSLITEAPAQSTIQIGLVQPLTGAFAAAGTDVVNGARIAADEINAKGGVLGKKLELITEDTKSNPTEAAAVAEKLIVRDKVPVLMGASASTATLAVMPASRRRLASGRPGAPGLSVAACPEIPVRWSPCPRRVLVSRAS